MTSRQEISGWFDEGKENNATHMIIVCDTFDHDDYPAYAYSEHEAKAKYKHFDSANMQKVMEVYDLRMDKETQMKEHRAFHLPK